jgi:hypothetical protein
LRWRGIEEVRIGGGERKIARLLYSNKFILNLRT